MGKWKLKIFSHPNVHVKKCYNGNLWKKAFREKLLKKSLIFYQIMYWLFMWNFVKCVKDTDMVKLNEWKLFRILKSLFWFDVKLLTQCDMVKVEIYVLDVL